MCFILVTTFFLLIVLVSVRVARLSVASHRVRSLTRMPAVAAVAAAAQAIVDTFVPVRDEMGREDAAFERRALHEAFNMLDVHDSGFMTWDIFRLLIKASCAPGRACFVL